MKYIPILPLCVPVPATPVEVAPGAGHHRTNVRVAQSEEAVFFGCCSSISLSQQESVPSLGFVMSTVVPQFSQVYRLPNCNAGIVASFRTQRADFDPLKIFA